MADLTRFDFHVVRFMNSEDVERMSAEEIGQYLLLLCKSWLLGKETTLPDDLEYLAKQARSKKVSSIVLNKFPVVDTPEGKRRRNSVLYGEWLLAKDRQYSYSERGKKGNEARYSDSNSYNNSDDVAIAQVTACSRPIPLTYQSINKPTQSNDNYGQGEYKTISTRWWSCFRKQLQKSKQNKEQYATACTRFGEDNILKYLEIWAKDNQWVSAHPKGGNRLYVFLQTLPEMIEGDEFRDVREQEQKKADGPEILPNDIEKIRQANSEAIKKHFVVPVEEPVTDDIGF